MEKYDRILANINNYLNLDDVLISDDVISAYSLFEILDNKFSELREVAQNKDLITKINKDNEETVGTIIKRKKKLTEWECNLFNMDFTPDGNKILNFFFSNHGPSYQNRIERIGMDGESNEIFFPYEMTELGKKIVTNHYEDIINTFVVFDKFKKYYEIENSKLVEKEIEIVDPYFNVKIKYNDRGDVNKSITVKEEKNKEIFNRNWYEKDMLADIVNNNSDTILKKIPVHISQLDKKVQTIVSEKLKEEKSPQCQYVKK